MKTIVHKGKLLHHHAASGFYIDLAAAIAFAEQLTRDIEIKKAEWDAYLAGRDRKCPKADEHRLLLLRTNKIVLEDPTDIDFGYRFGAGDGHYWASNVAVTFCNSEFGNDYESTEGLHQKWREYIGKRTSYSLPWCKSPRLAANPITADWFPMSACYSPARIALENLQ